jgi:hypothetical protein
MKTSRAKIASAFKVALAHMWDGKDGLQLMNSETLDKYICHGLERVYKNGGKAAIKIINDRLDGSMTLETWLASEGYTDSYYNTKKMQITRKAWLESLIEEFSK